MSKSLFFAAGALVGAVILAWGLFSLGVAVDYSATAPTTGLAGAAADKKFVGDLMVAFGTACFGFGAFAASVYRLMAKQEAAF